MILQYAVQLDEWNLTLCMPCAVNKGVRSKGHFSSQQKEPHGHR